MMIKRMELRNFKCFDNFVMDSISPITIIGGPNNAGKSTVLEAVLTNYAAGNLGVFWSLVNLRNGYISRPLLPHQVWGPLFCNEKNCNELIINSAWDNGTESRLGLFKIFDSGLQHQPNNVLSAVHMMIDSPNYKRTGKCMIQQDMMNNNRIVFQPDTGNDINLEEFTQCFANSLLYKGLPYDARLPERMSQLVLDAEKKELLMEVLQRFDINVADIRTVLDNGIPYAYVILKDGNSLPVNYMGDGINKALIIIMNLLTLPGGIFLIDEMENGFYYEMYEPLLKIFCETALKMKCQVIMTTHNLHIIKAVLSVMEELNKMEHFCYQRIDLSPMDGKRRPYAFSGKALKSAFETNMEIR